MFSLYFDFGPDCTVSITKFSSVTLNDLTMEGRRKDTVISSCNKSTNKPTDINPIGVKIKKTLFRMHGSQQINCSDISEYFRCPKEKFKLHYGRCTGLLFRTVT